MGPMGPNGPMGPGMGGQPTSLQAQLEWQKMQQQFIQEKGKKGGGMPPGNMMMGPGGMQMGPRGMMGPGGRMTGPPPPYPQSGSRGLPPGAMISPNPGSPATSLPLSSPVMMNSPRHMGSNPGTPVSGAPMTSPVGGPRLSPGLQGPGGNFIWWLNPASPTSWVS